MAGPAFVPTPLPRPPRWPGLVASVGGEQAIRRYITEEAPSEGGVDRWLNGYEFQPYHCTSGDADDGGTIGGMDVCTITEPTFTATGSLPATIETTPLLLWESMRCSTLSNNAAELTDRVSNRLLITTSHRLESELWSGAVAQAEALPNQYLTDSGSYTSHGTQPLVHALSYLQHYGAESAEGNRLMIHASPFTASLWYAAGALVLDSSGLLLDAFGNVVVAGTGYPGTGDGVLAAAVPNTAWAFATTMVSVRMTDIEVQDARNTRVDKTNNIDVATASRVASIQWDGCVHEAVIVDHTAICG